MIHPLLDFVNYATIAMVKLKPPLVPFKVRKSRVNRIQEANEPLAQETKKDIP